MGCGPMRSSRDTSAKAPGVQAYRVARGTVADTLYGWPTISEVIGADEVEIQSLREAGSPLLHVLGFEPAERILDLGGGTVELPVELFELRLRAVRHLSPFAVGTAKLDFPHGGVGLTTLRQVNQERPTGAARWQ